MMLIRKNAQVRRGKTSHQKVKPTRGGGFFEAGQPSEQEGERGRGLLCETASRGYRVGRVEEGKGRQWRKCTNPDKSRLGPIHTRIYSRPWGLYAARIRDLGPTRRGDGNART